MKQETDVLEAPAQTQKMTQEEVRRFRAQVIQQFQEDYEKNPEPFIFTTKYLMAQESYIEQKVRELWEKNPDLSPGKVVETILSKLPDFLPPWNLRQVTDKILSEWEQRYAKGGSAWKVSNY